MSLWFLERELRGFSSYFIEESKNEQEHAKSISDYLVARGQTVLLADIPAPCQNWNSIEEVIAASFQLESDVTTSLHQLYAMAERSADTRTNVFLDPIIDNQVSAEDEFAYLLGKVRFADGQPSALLIIDSELKK